MKKPPRPKRKSPTEIISDSQTRPSRKNKWLKQLSQDDLNYLEELKAVFNSKQYKDGGLSCNAIFRAVKEIIPVNCTVDTFHDWLRNR